MLKKLSEMVNSENNSLKTKLQEEQEKFTSLQEDHKLCEERFKSLTQNVDSMLTEKHNLNSQLMEHTNKLNKSQSDLVLIKEEAEKAESSEQEKDELSKKKKNKVRRKKSKAKKNKTKAASSDSTPQPPSTPKSQDFESPSDSNSDMYCLIYDSETHHISDCIYNQGVSPYGSNNKFKPSASSKNVATTGLCLQQKLNDEADKVCPKKFIIFKLCQVSKPKHSFGPTQKQLWRKTPVKNQDEQCASSTDGPPEDAIYQEVTYIDDFGQSKTVQQKIPKVEQKKSQSWTITNQIPKRNSEDSQRERKQKIIPKRNSKRSPKVDQIQIDKNPIPH
ncbi:hypothetical protein QVD17_12018 [Tagetes erecta]|uniref:Uncharacterized protein n=1 Tax=Tagetes erecta TaxID=13708 RepID=A0AAD8KW78_TARER|nr:hypothetical protein QVD17_12018 [Tagetes erecta]